MALLTVGPSSTYPTIAAAMAVANPGDTISLETGYSGERAVVSVDNISVTGDSSSTDIHLRLNTGVGTVTLLGNAPIGVHDSAGNNTITGNAGANVIRVTGGIDVVHGANGVDQLIVDYATATSSVIGTVTGITDGGSHAVTFDGIENFIINTGSGNDTITAGDGANVIKTRDGDDTITSGNGQNFIGTGGGNDTLTLGDGNNLVHGGAGNDTLTSGNGQTLIDAGVGDDTVVAGDGGNDIQGNAGNDTITAGTGQDVIYAGRGNDTIIAGGGDDTVFLKKGADSVDGGVGNDTADYSQMSLAVHVNLANTTAQIVNAVETDTLTSIENVKGSDFGDTLTGDLGSNRLNGGLGADQLNGDGGADTFVYASVNDSTSALYDTITGFNAVADKFDFKFGVKEIDVAVTTGDLSTSTFDTDLASAVGASELGKHHAVLFTPDSGTLSGDTFLIVDANGIAGYQAGQDVVIDLAGATNLASLSAADFI